MGERAERLALRSQTTEIFPCKIEMKTMTHQSVNMQVSKQVYLAGQKLIGAPGREIANVLNLNLNELSGSHHFRAGPGSAIDDDGQRTNTFGTLIRAATLKDPSAGSITVAADKTACVIDISENMDIASFRVAYGRIAEAKSLKKTGIPPEEGVDQTTVTLGIIFAINSVEPLEILAEELERLNAKTPTDRWPEMVVILSKGVINYGVQFPGEGISGDLLPPAEGALTSASPPIYVILLIHPTGKYSFNKMCAYLFAHLGLFSPQAKLPFFKDVLEGTPSTALTVCGYQYNVRGELLPVPRQFYNDRYLAPLPMRIEDDQGNLLSTIQFMPWQDGGVIILKGKLPLEGMLIFLGPAGLRGGGVRRQDVQISNVLPINWTNFVQMLQNFQRQSNMVVKNPEAQIMVQKMADEGTSSPFIARVFYAILRFRDQALLDKSNRTEFDAAYNFVLTELMNARKSAKDLNRILNEHMRKISDSSITRVHGQVLHIDENIDQELGKLTEDFIGGTARALKHGMQTLAEALGIDIGFLFQKAGSFMNGLAALEKVDSFLAEYLKQSRPWCEQLSERRNAIEHHGWKLPKIKYGKSGTVLQAEEPELDGQKLTQFFKYILDRLMCFVEEVTIHCLQRHMHAGMSITEVPLVSREPDIPLRFQATVKTGGKPIWRIQYHSTLFEDT